MTSGCISSVARAHAPSPRRAPSDFHAMRPLRIALPFALGALVALSPSLVAAQRLRERISQLFVFGQGQEPLFLAGSATSSNSTAIRAHGNHFIPSQVAENGSIIGFLTGALGASVSNVPIGATTSGETFRFEGGVPVSTATSAGPIFAERGQTLGRGRVLVPTDVVVARVAKIHGAGGASARGTFRDSGPVDGTNCCLIRMAGDPRPHVLGCNHVIFLTELRPNPTAAELPGFQLSFGGQIIGPPELRITVGTIDAAIVPFPTATPGDELVGRPEVRLADWVRSEAVLPYHCQALTARDEVPLEYDGVGPHEVCCFHGNGTNYTYPMVLQYKYVTGKRTIPGDSGSPWVDSNNRLVALHVAGDDTHAFAIPMYTLIERFGGKLTPILAL